MKKISADYLTPCSLISAPVARSGRKSAFEQGPSWLAPNFEGHSLKQTNKTDTE